MIWRSAWRSVAGRTSGTVPLQRRTDTMAAARVVGWRRGQGDPRGTIASCNPFLVPVPRGARPAGVRGLPGGATERAPSVLAHPRRRSRPACTRVVGWRQGRRRSTATGRSSPRTSISGSHPDRWRRGFRRERARRAANCTGTCNPAAAFACRRSYRSRTPRWPVEVAAYQAERSTHRRGERRRRRFWDTARSLRRAAWRSDQLVAGSRAIALNRGRTPATFARRRPR